jgi:hypothetical protein
MCKSTISKNMFLNLILMIQWSAYITKRTVLAVNMPLAQEQKNDNAPLKRYL